MNAFALSLLLFVLQSQAPNPAAPLVGTWSVSASAPLPGRTAPFGPQSFTIALEGGRVMVTMGREAAVEADVYVAPRPFFGTGSANGNADQGRGNRRVSDSRHRRRTCGGGHVGHTRRFDADAHVRATRHFCEGEVELPRHPCRGVRGTRDA